MAKMFAETTKLKWDRIAAGFYFADLDPDDPNGFYFVIRYKIPDGWYLGEVAKVFFGPNTLIGGGNCLEVFGTLREAKEAGDEYFGHRFSD